MCCPHLFRIYKDVCEVANELAFIIRWLIKVAIIIRWLINWLSFQIAEKIDEMVSHSSTKAMDKVMKQLDV